jgi:hypothetical protein
MGVRMGTKIPVGFDGFEVEIKGKKISRPKLIGQYSPELAKWLKGEISKAVRTDEDEFWKGLKNGDNGPIH